MDGAPAEVPHVHLLLRAADRYLRRSDTSLARLLARASPAIGPEYGRSAVKRLLDLSIGVPAALAAFPLIAVLVLINKLLNPGQPAFFVQVRVGHDELPMRIVKIRSMTRRAGAGTRPSATVAGTVIRRHYLDELPQLVAVVRGNLSLVGIRILPSRVFYGRAAVWSPERFRRWRETYMFTPLGLTGLHQVSRGQGKEDDARFHRDVFYATRESLGFDLYLLWRTMLRAVRR